jgi:hypothetical protein
MFEVRPPGIALRVAPAPHCGAVPEHCVGVGEVPDHARIAPPRVVAVTALRRVCFSYFARLALHVGADYQRANCKQPVIAVTE